MAAVTMLSNGRGLNNGAILDGNANRFNHPRPSSQEVPSPVPFPGDPSEFKAGLTMALLAYDRRMTHDPLTVPSPCGQHRTDCRCAYSMERPPSRNRSSLPTNHPT